MKHIRITNLSSPGSRSILAKYCQSFWCQLRGLMFTRSLPEDAGVLLVQGRDSRLDASIHMMFMWMDLAVIWIDSEYSVVDKVVARCWKLAYLPQKPARYVLETGVTHISDFNIGDRVNFEEL